VPLPAGAPDIGVLSRTLTATCLPAGVVSTNFPSPPFAVTTSPFGAIARPSGSFRCLPLVIIAGLIGALRVMVLLTAPIALAALFEVPDAAPGMTCPTPHPVI
jgi:hypothetical protein